MNSELDGDKPTRILTIYPDLFSDRLLPGKEPMLHKTENESILYKMYKEGSGAFKERIRQLEGSQWYGTIWKTCFYCQGYEEICKRTFN